MIPGLGARPPPTPNGMVSDSWVVVALVFVVFHSFPPPLQLFQSVRPPVGKQQVLLAGCWLSGWLAGRQACRRANPDSPDSNQTAKQSRQPS